MLTISWIAGRIMAGWYSNLFLKRKGTGGTYDLFGNFYTMGYYKA